MTREDVLRWSDIGSRLIPWGAVALLGYGATTVAEVRADIRALRADIVTIQIKIAEGRGVFLLALGKLEQRLADHERSTIAEK